MKLKKKLFISNIKIYNNFKENKTSYILLKSKEK